MVFQARWSELKVPERVWFRLTSLPALQEFQKITVPKNCDVGGVISFTGIYIKF